jgi:pathogenesis-related protein 1
MRLRMAVVSLRGMLSVLVIIGSEQILRAGGAEPAERAEETGSALATDEAEALVEFHNKARKEVGVAAVKWSPKLAAFAQAWADEIARTGEIQHRPADGEWRQRYGENMAWGMGRGYGPLTGAQYWYDEIKLYEPGAVVPEEISEFPAAHYAQMAWKSTTEIGAGKAIIRTGAKQGWMIVVCNYDPTGNVAGEKPY